MFKVGVIGAGTMGRGIAQLALQGGFEVTLYDTSTQTVLEASEKIREGLQEAAQKGKIKEGKAQEYADNLLHASRLEHFDRADLVIEAVFENLKVKQALFRELSRMAKDDAVLATNTSSLSVAEIANTVRLPERFLGMHFFNPPYAMKLVELVRLPTTDPQTVEKAKNFLKELGRVPVLARDTPGFIVNRVLRPFYLEAMRAAEEGEGCFTWIDEACRKAGGVPMGPLELTDFIGQDINLATTHSVWEALGKPERFRPSRLQEHLVQHNQLGKKTGAGFYLYKNGQKGEENPALLSLASKSETSQEPEKIWNRIMEAVADEADLLAGEKSASQEDIDTAVKLGAGFPRGPFEWRSKSAK